MSYFLEAVVGKRDEIRKNFTAEEALIIELPYEFLMIPLKNDLLERVNIRVDDDFELNIINWLSSKSKHSIFAFITAEFFGGSGGQIAKLFSNGKIIKEFSFDSNAINNILELLGLERSVAHDQFDMLQLSRFRNTEDWQ
ncbi:hypothetical protein [Leptospira koniambonensis]|uniref:hypothetical protein n=1 Tax=Leptospira koniambonensis TaxID=2484950 RepID=UPI003EB774B4